jgi:hypothetical protein
MRFRDILADPLLVGFYDEWMRLNGDRPLPRAADFDPGLLPDLAPHLTVVEPRASGRFHIRSVGREVVRGVGFDATGLDLNLAAEPGGKAYAAFLHRTYRSVIETRRPILSTVRYGIGRWERRILRRLSVPFGGGEGDAGGRVSEILSAVVFSPTADERPEIILDRDGEAVVLPE